MCLLHLPSFRGGPRARRPPATPQLRSAGGARPGSAAQGAGSARLQSPRGWRARSKDARAGGQELPGAAVAPPEEDGRPQGAGGEEIGPLSRHPYNPLAQQGLRLPSDASRREARQGARARGTRARHAATGIPPGAREPLCPTFLAPAPGGGPADRLPGAPGWPLPRSPDLGGGRQGSEGLSPARPSARGRSETSTPSSVKHCKVTPDRLPHGRRERSKQERGFPIGSFCGEDPSPPPQDCRPRGFSSASMDSTQQLCLRSECSQKAFP